MFECFQSKWLLACCWLGDNRRGQPSREREGLRSRCGEDRPKGQWADILHCGLQWGWTRWGMVQIPHSSCPFPCFTSCLQHVRNIMLPGCIICKSYPGNTDFPGNYNYPHWSKMCRRKCLGVSDLCQLKSCVSESLIFECGLHFFSLFLIKQCGHFLQIENTLTTRCSDLSGIEPLIMCWPEWSKQSLFLSGDVSIGIKCAPGVVGPAEADIDFDIIKNDNDTFTVKYMPPGPGQYTIMVLFADQVRTAATK